MKLKVLFLALSLALFDHAKAQNDTLPYVVLISFDGFRHDYADSLDLPNFNRFVQNGSHADALIPCFPSVTFPNHYSIVTGLYPEHHGMVDNHFFDRQRWEVFLSSSTDKAHDPYYYNGKTIWTLAKEQGVKTASYYWLSSDLPDPKLQPDHYYEYGKGGTSRDEIDQALDWLKLPEKERPHLITLYFNFPDAPAHRSGPWSEETKQAVQRADSLLGMLLNGLAQLGLPVNTIVVSDHGLAELKVGPDTFIYLDSLMDTADSSFKVVISGTLAHIYSGDPAKTDSLYRLLKKEEKDFSVYESADFPERWHYTDNPRIGDILVVADTGHYIPRSDQAGSLKGLAPESVMGIHGYDPSVDAGMQGIFYAWGPNIRKGVEIPAFQNIDIFPLLARILKLKLPPIDGNPETLKGIYIGK